MDTIQCSPLPDDVLKIIANKCGHNERQILRKVNTVFRDYIPYGKFILNEHLPLQILQNLCNTCETCMSKRYRMSNQYSLFKVVTKSGNLENMKWLKENGYTSWDTSVFKAAVNTGILENMKWLKENRCISSDDLINLPCLSLWDMSMFYIAAKTGILENMKWLKENGCPWGYYTFCAAAKLGNLENMKWLKENGCPLDTCSYLTFTSAAKLEI